MWRKFAADYLRFSKKERLAALLLCAAILGVYLAPLAFSKTAGTAVRQDTALQRLLDSGLQQAAPLPGHDNEENATAYQYEDLKKFETAEGALFYFDPNTLDAAGWEKLGLRPKTIQTLLNYRSKGGHFYRHEDLKKIWGLPHGFYERVEAYIRLEERKKEYTATANPSASSEQDFFKTPYEKKGRTVSAVDVNTADTAALIALPGIGSKLAQRIVSFRDKLGGFYTADQIGETYGLPDSTFQKLKPYLQVHGPLKKLNLNAATKDDLKMHPYIRWNLANAIVEYRAQHGPFKKLDELKNIVLIDEAAFQKIVPYVTL